MSILITRVATIALTHTGLTKASAKFQARSAFSGAGFTTSESEMVVNHPVRRKIVMLLILLGNAGLVTAVSSLILTFVRQGDSATGSIVKRSGSRRRCSKKKHGKTVRKNEIEQLNDEIVFLPNRLYC
jgi:Trk-type K+ transport system membrane component